jgi:hypothetical protein
VEAADVADGVPDGLAHVRLDGPERGLELGLARHQPVGREVGLVELAAEARDGLVAAFTDLLDDAADRLQEGREVGLRTGQEADALVGERRSRWWKLMRAAIADLFPGSASVPSNHSICCGQYEGGAGH